MEKFKISNISKLDVACIATIIALNLCLFIGKFTNFSIRGVSICFFAISLFELIIGCLQWYKKNKMLNHPFIYFVLACYLCWFGQVAFVALGFTSINEVVITKFNPVEFALTCKYANLGFVCMFLGGYLFSKPIIYDLKNDKYLHDRKLYRTTTMVACSMIALSVIPHIWALVSGLVKSLQIGYMGMFGNDYTGILRSIYNLVSSFSMFFWPGMFLLLVSNKNNAKVIVFTCICALIEVLILFVIGTRSEAIALIITLFWLYTTLYRKVDLKLIITIILIGFVFLRLLTIVAIIRTSDNRSIFYFFYLFFTLPFSQMFDILREFGFSIFSLHYTIKLVPATTNYALGYTYLASILAVIPSLLMGGFSFSSAAALPEWLMTNLNMKYGPGYSIVAESYYNFGFFGYIAMFIIGVILCKMFNNNDKKGDMRILFLAFIAIVLYSNLFIARDTFLFVFRKYIYLVLLPLLAIKILYKFSDKKFINKLISKFSFIIRTLERDNFKFETGRVLVIKEYKNQHKNILNNIKKKLKTFNLKTDILVLSGRKTRDISEMLKILHAHKYDTIICNYNDIWYKCLNISKLPNLNQIVLFDDQKVFEKKQKKINIFTCILCNQDNSQFINRVVEERKVYYEE